MFLSKIKSFLFLPYRLADRNPVYWLFWLMPGGREVIRFFWWLSGWPTGCHVHKALCLWNGCTGVTRVRLGIPWWHGYGWRLSLSGRSRLAKCRRRYLFLTIIGYCFFIIGMDRLFPVIRFSGYTVCCSFGFFGCFISACCFPFADPTGQNPSDSLFSYFLFFCCSHLTPSFCRKDTAWHKSGGHLWSLCGFFGHSWSFMVALSRFGPMKIPEGGFLRAGNQWEIWSCCRLQDQLQPSLRNRKPEKPLHLFICIFIWLIYMLL